MDDLVVIHSVGRGKCRLNKKETTGVFCTFPGDPRKENIFLGWKGLQQLCSLDLESEDGEEAEE